MTHIFNKKSVFIYKKMLFKPKNREKKKCLIWWRGSGLFWTGNFKRHKIKSNKRNNSQNKVIQRAQHQIKRIQVKILQQILNRYHQYDNVKKADYLQQIDQYHLIH